MKLYYCQTPDGNFGDDMNLWFWDELAPFWREAAPDRTLCGIGTLINRKAFSVMDKVLVCGSGTGYGQVAPFDSEHVQFAWVRGPRTAELLGLGKETAITDPAAMVSDFDSFADRAEGPGDVIFVPHRLTANLDLDWTRLGQRAGVRVVSPKEDARAVIRELRDARLVIAESMHAAIIADTFRTPWVPLAVSHHFNDFKWGDWAESMEVDLRVNEALRFPRRTYFALRDMRARLRRPAPKPHRDTRTESNGAPTEPFENPNYMQKDERDRMKGLIRRFSGPVETLLARDIRRAAGLSPSLSEDAVLERRKTQIRERIDAIHRQYGSAV